MKYSILLFLVFQASFRLLSQMDMGMPVSMGKGGVASTIVKDYEVIGVNPSNLGWNDNHTFSVTGLVYGMYAQSNALKLNQLSKALFTPQRQIASSVKSELTQTFGSGESFNLQSFLTYMAFSVRLPKLGGIAVNLRDRVSVHITSNQQLTDFAFNGNNASFLQDTNAQDQLLSTVFEHTRLQFLHYRELNISYGNCIFKKGIEGKTISIYAGVGYKYLWGLGFIKVKGENGTFSAQSALTNSKYKINQAYIDDFKINRIPGVFNSSGNGQAFDWGVSAILNGKYKAALSMIDIGSITWNKNLIEANDQPLNQIDSTFTGIYNFKLRNKAGMLFNSENGLISFSERNTPYKTRLTTKLRFGAGWKIAEGLEIGGDVQIPLLRHQNLADHAYCALGGEFRINRKIWISTGIAGNKAYGTSIPVGITLGSIGITEIYLATGDILTFLNPNKNPLFSFAIGILRINLN